jgi:hypothetical protein
VLFLTGTSLVFLWALSRDLRQAVKSVIRSLAAIEWPPWDAMLLAGSLAVVAMFALFLFLWMTSREWFPGRRHFVIIALLAFSGGISFVDIAFRDRTRYKDGATEVAAFITDHGFQRIVVAGYERNPQLTYYLGGADIGWRNDIAVRRILPPSSRQHYASWLIEELSGEPSTTLLLIEKDKFVRYEFIDPQDFVPADYQLVLDTRRYSAYLRAQEDFLAAHGGTNQ